MTTARVEPVDDGVVVRENAAAQRFEVWVGDELAGFLTYRPLEDATYAATTPRSVRRSRAAGWPTGS